MEWYEPWPKGLKLQQRYDLFTKKSAMGLLGFSAAGFILFVLMDVINESFQFEQIPTKVGFSLIFGAFLEFSHYSIFWICPNHVRFSSEGIWREYNGANNLLDWPSIKTYTFAEHHGVKCLSLELLAGTTHLLPMRSRMTEELLEDELQKFSKIKPIVKKKTN